MEEESQSSLSRTDRFKMFAIAITQFAEKLMASYEDLITDDDGLEILVKNRIEEERFEVSLHLSKKVD